MARTATNVVYARFTSTGTPIPYSGWGCEQLIEDDVVDVSGALKGSINAGALSLGVDSIYNYFGPLDASIAQDGVFFFRPYFSDAGSANLLIGYLWQQQGQWVGSTMISGTQLTTAELEARVLNPDAGLCNGELVP